MFVDGGGKRLFVDEVADPVRDRGGGVSHEVRSNKAKNAMRSLDLSGENDGGGVWAAGHLQQRQQQQGEQEQQQKECKAMKALDEEKNSISCCRSNSGMGLLGSDQLLCILAHLPVQALVSFGMTCKRNLELVDTDSLWAHVCKREWGSRVVEAWPTSTSAPHKLGWKRLYRQMLILNGAAWHSIPQGDIVPAPRASHSLNVVDGNIRLFGGGCDGGRHLDDTWCAAIPGNLKGGIAWQRMFADRPPGRFGQCCCIVDNVVVLYGGINDKGTRLGDTWICVAGGAEGAEGGTSGGSSRDGSPRWQMLEVAQSPSPRGAHDGCAAGDKKIVIFGGIASDGTRLGDTWVLDLAESSPQRRWREVVTPFSPRPRSGHSMTWIGGKRIILFGGRGVDFEVMNDVWLLDMESDFPAWVELRASSEPRNGHDCPSARAGHSATLVFGGRILVFGGEDAKRVKKGDVWVMDPSVGFQAAAQDPSPFLGTLGSRNHRSCATNAGKSSKQLSRRFWKKLKQVGRPPSKRSFHAACAVDTGHIVIIFGGMVDGERVPAASTGLGFDAELHMLQLVP